MKLTIPLRCIIAIIILTCMAHAAIERHDHQGIYKVLSDEPLISQFMRNMMLLYTNVYNWRRFLQLPPGDVTIFAWKNRPNRYLNTESHHRYIAQGHYNILRHKYTSWFKVLGDNFGIDLQIYNSPDDESYVELPNGSHVRIVKTIVALGGVCHILEHDLWDLAEFKRIQIHDDILTPLNNASAFDKIPEFLGTVFMPCEKGKHWSTKIDLSGEVFYTLLAPIDGVFKPKMIPDYEIYFAQGKKHILKNQIGSSFSTVNHAELDLRLSNKRGQDYLLANGMYMPIVGKVQTENTMVYAIEGNFYYLYAFITTFFKSDHSDITNAASAWSATLKELYGDPSTNVTMAPITLFLSTNDQIDQSDKDLNKFRSYSNLIEPESSELKSIIRQSNINSSNGLEGNGSQSKLRCKDKNKAIEIIRSFTVLDAYVYVVNCSLSGLT